MAESLQKKHAGEPKKKNVAKAMFNVPNKIGGCRLLGTFGGSENIKS
jgi:hypothetical protein